MDSKTWSDGSEQQYFQLAGDKCISALFIIFFAFSSKNGM